MGVTDGMTKDVTGDQLRDDAWRRRPLAPPPSSSERNSKRNKASATRRTPLLSRILVCAGAPVRPARNTDSSRRKRPSCPSSMRVVHFCMGLVPPLLQSETATEQMARHAPQPSPMPARMRSRFTATIDAGVTRVFPKRGQRAGGALIYLHGGAYVYPMVAGQWGVVEGLIDRTGLPVIIPDYPIAPAHTATDAFDVVQPIIDEAQAEFGRVILFGDSAGGGLALSLAMQRRDAGAAAGGRPRPVRPVGGRDDDEPGASRRCSAATGFCACLGWRGRAARGPQTWIRLIRASAPCTVTRRACRRCACSRGTRTLSAPT